MLPLRKDFLCGKIPFQTYIKMWTMLGLEFVIAEHMRQYEANTPRTGIFLVFIFGRFPNNKKFGSRSAIYREFDPTLFVQL